MDLAYLSRLIILETSLYNSGSQMVCHGTGVSQDFMITKHYYCNIKLGLYKKLWMNF